MLDYQHTYQLKSVTNCLSPIKVFNKYLGEFMIVPCRHCMACQNAYALNLQTRIENECKQHKYSFFFTLTYDNKHLPMYRLVVDCPFLDAPCFMSNRKDDLATSFFDFTNDYPQAVRQKYNGFGYCCKSDIQKFLKRLRRHIETNTDLKLLSKNEKKVRYFISSEYGPTTFRPHYHGILWVDNDQLADLVPKLLRQTWTLCNKNRIDIQLVSGSAPQYVAKYVNGNTNLPKVLQLKFTRTFHLASKNPILGDFQINTDLLHEMLFRGVSRYSVPDTDTLTLKDVSISNSYYNRFFPKCQQFSVKTNSSKLSILKKYENLIHYRYCHSYEDVSYNYSVLLTEWKMEVPYQDRRFAKLAYYWCHKLNISYDYYLERINILYSNRILAMMSDDYELQQSYIDKYSSKLKVLKFYPLIFNSLPSYFPLSDFIQSPLNSVLHHFGLSYYDLYHNEYLIDLSTILHDDDDSYHINQVKQIIFDSNKNKILNEKLSSLYSDY